MFEYNNPSLYVFKVEYDRNNSAFNSDLDTLCNSFYYKIGDTHRPVDVRIQEWNKVLINKFNNMWPLISMLSCCVVALLAAIFHGGYVSELRNRIDVLEKIANQCEDYKTKKL